jgi:general secretion pathway protein I
MRRRGFTLLEMLVASSIMGIAVVALLANLSTSMRNAVRLSEYDRATVLARGKMDELLLNSRVPLDVLLEGTFDRSLTGNTEAGWRARLTPYEMPPNANVGTSVLQRLEMEVWWGEGNAKHKIQLEGFRRGTIAAVQRAHE